MKTFKDIISEVAEPKGGDEKRFKAKHVVAKYNHPSAEDEQFTAKNVKKDKSKLAGYHDGKDKEVYEEADVHTKRADKKAVIVHNVDSEGKSKTTVRKQRAGEIKVEGYVSDAQRKAVHASKDEQKKKKKTYKEMFSGESLQEDPWEEVPMMTRQLEFICDAAEDIMEYVESGIDPEEWFQNKLAHVHGQMQGLYAYVEGDMGMRKAKMAMDEEVELDEKVYASDYNVGHEKSQFGGYRPHVTHKKTGKTMYLGQTSYKKPEHAKGHASAYLKGYEAMGDRHASRKANEYEKSNKQHVYKEEVELDESQRSLDAHKFKQAAKVKAGIPLRRPGESLAAYVTRKAKAQAKMQKEDVEQDRINKAAERAHAWRSKIQTGNLSKSEKSRIKKAADKAHKERSLTREDVELDEAFKMGLMKLKDGSTVKLSKEEAEAVNELFNELNSSNKKRMEEEMMKNKSGFDKVLKFAKEAM